MKTLINTSANTRIEQRRTFQRMLLLLVCAITCTGMFSSCAVVLGSRADYFSYRNTIPAPPQEAFTTDQQGNFNATSSAWTNPMQVPVVSSVAFVPVITPWYDSWSFFARPSLRFRSFGDPYFGGGFGWGGGGAFAGGFDPYWNGGFGSSFMYYSCPWYNFNPYFGGYTPFGFYRPIGWWSSNNFTNIVNNTYVVNNTQAGGGVNNDRFADPQMRQQQAQRAYDIGKTNATYVGAYDGGGAGGGRSRAEANYYSAASSNVGNRASQYNTSTYSSGSGAVDSYRSSRSTGGYGNSGYSSGSSYGTSNYNSGSYGGGRSSGGYSGGGGNYGGGSNGASNRSNGGSSGGSSGGGKSTGGYGGGGKH